LAFCRLSCFQRYFIPCLSVYGKRFIREVSVSLYKSFAFLFISASNAMARLNGLLRYLLMSRPTRLRQNSRTACLRSPCRKLNRSSPRPSTSKLNNRLSTHSRTDAQKARLFYSNRRVKSQSPIIESALKVSQTFQALYSRY